jgi:hypothetical protein
MAELKTMGVVSRGDDAGELGRISGGTLCDSLSVASLRTTHATPESIA